jgi:hypothetical protein
MSYRHWPWRNGVNKTPPFLHFLAKGEQGPFAHLPFAERLSFRSLGRHILFMIVNCGMKNKNLIQVRSELSPPTSKLVALLAIKKQ